MSAPTNSNEGGSSLHVRRSEVIDAFAKVEDALVALLRLGDKKVTTAPLGQKIAVVRKIGPSPSLSKKRRDEVHEALDKLQPLLARRTEIAHSPMLIVRVGDEPEGLAGFANPALQPTTGRSLQVYTLQNLQHLTDEVRDIARQLAG